MSSPLYHRHVKVLLLSPDIIDFVVAFCILVLSWRLFDLKLVQIAFQTVELGENYNSLSYYFQIKHLDNYWNKNYYSNISLFYSLTCSCISPLLETKVRNPHMAGEQFNSDLCFCDYVKHSYLHKSYM